jgi:hypothetical protein
MVKTVTSSEIKGYKKSTIAKRESNDCSVRAVANAFDIKYDKAHKFLKDTYKRSDRKGVVTYFWHNTNDKFADEGKVVFGKKFVKIEYPEVEVTRKRCTKRATWWDDSSDSYEYTKKLKLYTKRGKNYSQMTVGAFIKKYPVGTFILSVRSHTFTIKDGVVYGNFSDGRMLRVRLEKVWQIK